jgi:Domain of unknown function (DUF4157)
MIRSSRIPKPEAKAGAGPAGPLARPALGGAPLGLLQRKLAIGSVNDPAEREADTIADQVMRTTGPVSVSAAQRQLSRKCGAREQEEPDRMLRAKTAPAAMQGGMAPPVASDVLRTPGRALDAASRALFEPRFGFDFGRVRIHDDAGAAAAAAAVSARAYTVGDHIVFANRQFEPATERGRALLAHELVHVLQQRSGLHLRRQVAKPATEKQQRQFVQDTINFLQDAGRFFQMAKVDDAIFDRVIDSWYSMVVRQEKIVDTDLHGDAALKAQLHTAYISALRVLVTRHAAASGKTETDLYRINSGRIPLWAQPHPSHLEPRVTTPIPDDVPVTRARGRFRFSLGGFDVLISPDTRAAHLRTPGAKGETHPHIHFGGISFKATGPKGSVTWFAGPGRPILTLDTTYLRGVDTASASGYGRGTTAEDKAGANVTPQSQSLAFHEGRHGQEALDFIRSNPPPAFTGKAGDTVAVFENAMSAYRRAVIDYSHRMDAADSSHVHCVGVTIDQYHAAGARRGTRIVKECP